MYLPKELQKKRCFLNIQNEDDHKCIAYCVLANRDLQMGNKKKNSSRPSSYKLEELNTHGVKFPPSECDVSYSVRRTVSSVYRIQSILRYCQITQYIDGHDK